jgi:putative FmdB family regulatory protein
MPIYEYQCPKCGAEFEKLVTGQTAVACPVCENPNVKRAFSLFGLKTGTGFTPSGGGGCGCSPTTCGCH